MQDSHFAFTLGEAFVRWHELSLEIMDLHARKNANYAGTDSDDPLANFMLSEYYTQIPAYLGVINRMTDKWARIRNLLKGQPDQVGESLRDSLIDQAVYSLIAVMLLDRQRQGDTVNDD